MKAAGYWPSKEREVLMKTPTKIYITTSSDILNMLKDDLISDGQKQKILEEMFADEHPNLRMIRPSIREPLEESVEEPVDQPLPKVNCGQPDKQEVPTDVLSMTSTMLTALDEKISIALSRYKLMMEAMTTEMELLYTTQTMIESLRSAEITRLIAEQETR